MALVPMRALLDKIFEFFDSEDRFNELNGIELEVDTSDDNRQYGEFFVFDRSLP